MKFIDSKDPDQDQTEKACKLLVEFLKNQKSEPSLWIAAMMSVLADSFEGSEIPFEYFKYELRNVIEHYKY